MKYYMIELRYQDPALPIAIFRCMSTGLSRYINVLMSAEDLMEIRIIPIRKEEYEMRVNQ